MWSICKKEWRQFFSSLTGYLAIAVFLLLMGLFLFIFPDTSILDYGFATMDKFFDLAPWVLLLLIPAITMRSFPDEFKSGTWELLQTRPLTLGQIIGGKYLASLLLALLAVAPTLVYVFTIKQLSITGSIDTGGITGSYIGLIMLMAAFTAIGIFCSAFTPNSIVGFLAGALACFLLYSGFDALSRIPSFKGNADYYLEQIGIRYHYQSMSRGLIELKDVIYFLLVIGVFLAFTRKRLGERKRLFSMKAAWLLFPAIAVLVYSANTRFSGGLDLTAEKRFTLDEPTKKLLRNLDGPVEVDILLAGDNLPAGFRKLAASTQGFLERCQAVSGANFKYRFVEPDAFVQDSINFPLNDTFKTNLLKQAAVKQNEVTGTATKAAFSYPVAMVQYNGQFTAVNLLQGQSNKGFLNPDGTDAQLQVINNAEALLEYQFSSAIYSLTKTYTPIVAYATGNGEPSGPETYDLYSTLRQKYRFFTFDLKTQPLISDSFKTLIIAKPTEAFTDEEKLKLDQYVMRGGRVMFLLDVLNAGLDSLRASGNEFTAYDRGLELDDLLFKYGIRINDNLVQDLQSDVLPQVVGAVGNQPQIELLPWPYFPLLYPTANHPIVKNIDAVVMQFPQGIDTLAAAGTKKTILLATSNTSRSTASPAIITVETLKEMQNPSAWKLQNVPLAVLSEGTFSSLYANRISRAQMDTLQKEGTPFMQQGNGNGKVLVTSDGDWILNAFTKEGPLQMGANPYTQYTFANKDFLLNALEYLTDESGILQSRSKEYILRQLDLKKLEQNKAIWQWVNIGLPLILLLIAAQFFQWQRKRRFTK